MDATALSSNDAGEATPGGEVTAAVEAHAHEPSDLKAALAAYEAYRPHFRQVSSAHAGARVASASLSDRATARKRFEADQAVEDTEAELEKARESYNALATAVAEALVASPPAPGSDWPSVSECMTTTWEAFGCATILSDSIALGREPTDHEEALYRQAGDLVNAATDAVLAYEPKTVAELSGLTKLLEMDAFGIDETGEVRRAVSRATKAFEQRFLRTLDAIEEMSAPHDAFGFDRALADYRAAEAAARAAPNAESDAALDVEGRAEMAVYRTPAPDLNAVLEKMRINFMTACGTPGTLEDAIEDYQSTNDSGDEVIVNVYRDLQRLAGAFDPAEWVEAYRYTGNEVSLTPDGGILIGCRAEGSRRAAQQRLLSHQLTDARHREVHHHLLAVKWATDFVAAGGQFTRNAEGELWFGALVQGDPSWIG